MSKEKNLLNALTLSNRMFHEDGVTGSSKNKFNGDINLPYIRDTITFCTNEEFHLGSFSASPMSSEEHKNKYDTYDISNSKVTPSSHDTSKYND